MVTTGSERVEKVAWGNLTVKLLKPWTVEIFKKVIHQRAHLWGAIVCGSDFSSGKEVFEIFPELTFSKVWLKNLHLKPAVSVSKFQSNQCGKQLVMILMSQAMYVTFCMLLLSNIHCIL